MPPQHPSDKSDEISDEVSGTEVSGTKVSGTEVSDNFSVQTPGRDAVGEPDSNGIDRLGADPWNRRMGGEAPDEPSVSRRDFLSLATLAATLLPATLNGAGAAAGPFQKSDWQETIPEDKKLSPDWVRTLTARGKPTLYRGPELEKIGMPVGGICCGQLYLGGDGRLWHWDLFNLPQPGNFTNGGGPNYANPPKPVAPIEQGFAIRVSTPASPDIARPHILDSRGFKAEHIAFQGQYPVGIVDYQSSDLPVTVSLTAFSPFVPLNVEDSSLPTTILRFTVKNTGKSTAEVELGGWLENSVCLGSGMPELGRRRNRLVRTAQGTLLMQTTEALPKQENPQLRADILFEDFENGYGKWKVEGDAFGTEPPTGTLPGQQLVSGYLGKHLVNSFRNGDQTTGKMTSQPFTISRRYLTFLIGGGAHVGTTCMNLVVGGKVIHTATGHENEHLDWAFWDVSALEGQQAYLEIVDNARDGWGHINIDQIGFSDLPPANYRSLTEQEDYGSMGLLLLGDGKGDFGIPLLSDTPIDTLFSSNSNHPNSNHPNSNHPNSNHPNSNQQTGNQQTDNKTDAGGREAVLPFGKRLLGGVGRRFTLRAGQSAEVTFALVWHFPGLLRNTLGPLQDIATVRRAYATRFKDAASVAEYVGTHYARLSGQTLLWNHTWYDSSLPHWFLDRTFAPLCTLATSTCYLFDNGRFYAFEGVYCCQGTCQHVWNYAQGMARIFPALERDLRQRTDFGLAWHPNGATDYRGECARNVAHDGQCGVILRAYREHQMAENGEFLRHNWPRIRQSILYMIGCDADDNGILEGEQYNTLDASWYGPMAWISSLYIGALRAGEAMATEMGDPEFAVRCRTIAARGTQELVKQLYNGEYFIHKPDPKHPEATNTNDGCHIDQLMGQAWAFQVALPRIAPPAESVSSLQSLWKYNFTPDVGPFRRKSTIKGGRWYAMSGEGGMVETSFPRGGAEKATGRGGFAHYFNEVWTGQEHQVAAHFLWESATAQGKIRAELLERGMAITKMIHDRHHASLRNPYNEVECSDHYTRAMSSYGTFLAACGYEYHGPKGHVGFAPRLSPENFRAPFTVAEGWGTFSQQHKADSLHATLELKYGKLSLRTLALTLPQGKTARKAQVTLAGKSVPATFTQQGTRVQITFATDLLLHADQKCEVMVS